MVNAKTAKARSEVTKMKARLAEQQNKLRELEARQEEYENMEIVDIVRGMSVPLDDLASILRSIKDAPARGAINASGQVGLMPSNDGSNIEDATKGGAIQ